MTRYIPIWPVPVETPKPKPDKGGGGTGPVIREGWGG